MFYLFSAYVRFDAPLAVAW